jgi:hypothetical protein
MQRNPFASLATVAILSGIVSVVVFESLCRLPGAAFADEPSSLPGSETKDANKAARDEELQKLNVKYAQIYLQLAKVNLEKAQTLNNRVAGAFSAVEVDRLARLVQLAEERLAGAQHSGKQSDANRQSAEAAVNSAETTYKKSVATNERFPGAVSPLEVERQRLTVELAKLALAKANLVGGSSDALAGLQWEVDQLREDMLILRSRVEAITSRR